MKKVINLWYKVKSTSNGCEPEYYVVNFSQLIILILSLDDLDYLEITPTKFGIDASVDSSVDFSVKS